MRALLDCLRSSRFARDAAWNVALNLSTKLVSMFGNGFAARCLGPVNLGISGLVQNYSQQASLLYNGGFDAVAAREIAKDPTLAGAIMRSVVTMRALLCVVIGCGWVLGSLLIPGGIPLHVRLLGLPLLFLGALNVAFVFQGLEKVPVQTALGTLLSLLTSVLYFGFFHPEMPVGSDLVVMIVVNGVILCLSFLLLKRNGLPFPLGAVSSKVLFLLMRASWRYWVTSFAVFAYSACQIPLIAHFLGIREAGLFRAALAYAVGVEMFYGSVNSLLLPRLVAWQKAGEGHLIDRQWRLTWIYAAFAIGTTAILAASASLIYSLTFGPAYAAAVPLFRILLLSRAVVFIGQIYAYSMIARGQDKEMMWICVLGGGASVLSNFLVIPRFGIVGAAWSIVAEQALIHGLCVWADVRARRRFRT